MAVVKPTVTSDLGNPWVRRLLALFGWHAGFYFMANPAQLPIGLAYFNFARKEIGVTHYLMPSGNAQADLRQIARWYADHAQGKYPELSAPVQFKPLQ